MSALSDARAAVTAEVAALALADVTVVGYEPPTVSAGTTVTVSTAGVEGTEWLLAVRVYAAGMQADEAADTVDDTVTAVDAGLGTPRSSWTFGYDQGKQAFVAETRVAWPRQDF